MLPTSVKRLEIYLPSKPKAQIIASFTHGEVNALVVFLNGLGLPQSSWYPVINDVLESKFFDKKLPSFLTYDRFGQGETTTIDPLDEGKEPGKGHDLADVTRDLKELIAYVSKSELGSKKDVPLILVANSIGCSVARYFAETNPGRVSAILLLDSTLANSDFVSIYPDTTAPGFDEATLPGALTAGDVARAREAIGKVFLPTVPNKEGFWRGNQAAYLPFSDGPKLKGPGGTGLWVTVMGHDFEVFAEETTRMPGVVREIAVYYTNPFWHRFNQDLVKITDAGKARGPVIAEGAGHFIQQGRPDLVADELRNIITNVFSQSPRS